MLLCVPLAFCILALHSSLLWLIACVVSMFAVLALLPSARGHENMFLFVMCSVSLMPLNLALCAKLREFFQAAYSIKLQQLLWTGLLCLAMFSLEQLALGFLTRLIWKRQKKPFWCR